VQHCDAITRERTSLGPVPEVLMCDAACGLWRCTWPESSKRIVRGLAISVSEPMLQRSNRWNQAQLPPAPVQEEDAWSRTELGAAWAKVHG
jgi:hypothetical protein